MIKVIKENETPLHFPMLSTAGRGASTASAADQSNDHRSQRLGTQISQGIFRRRLHSKWIKWGIVAG